MNKIAEDLEDAVRRQNSKYCIGMLRNWEEVVWTSQSEVVQVKDKSGGSISDKGCTKERRAEHFENMLTVTKL